MTVRCGKCGNILFVSNRKDWMTDKENPEIPCDNPKCDNFGKPIMYIKAD